MDHKNEIKIGNDNSIGESRQNVSGNDERDRGIKENNVDHSSQFKEVILSWLKLFKDIIGLVSSIVVMIYTAIIISDARNSISQFHTDYSSLNGQLQNQEALFNNILLIYSQVNDSLGNYQNNLLNNLELIYYLNQTLSNQVSHYYELTSGELSNTGDCVNLNYGNSVNLYINTNTTTFSVYIIFKVSVVSGSTFFWQVCNLNNCFKPIIMSTYVFNNTDVGNVTGRLFNGLNIINSNLNPNDAMGCIELI